jgi:hypothetical protein
MANMGRYCKAYPVSRLRQFPQWEENLSNLRKEKKEIDGKEQEVARELTDDSYLYLQENFTVTDGIFIDENLIFDRVSPEWKEFCQTTLEFRIPGAEAAQSSGS